MFVIPFKVAITTPGTPQQLISDTALQGPAYGGTWKVHKICINQQATGTGKVYFGVNNLALPDGTAVTFSKTSGAGVMHTFLPPAASGLIDKICIHTPSGGDLISIGDYLVDADNATEGVTGWAEIG